MRVTILIIALSIILPACSGSSVKRNKLTILSIQFTKNAPQSKPTVTRKKKETLSAALKKHKISKDEWKDFVKNNASFVRKERKKAIVKHCSEGTEARLARNAPSGMKKGAGDHGRGEDTGRPENSGGPLSAPQQEAINDMWDIVGQ